jgi:drug/metabolite transporter (DMT)-like permease
VLSLLRRRIVVYYGATLAVSIAVFHEQISAMKWAGCAFIMAGAVFWLKG